MPRDFHRDPHARERIRDSKAPRPPAGALEEYRAAYRLLAAQEPEAARGFPDPDEPGLDAQDALKRIRARPGGLRAVPPGDLKG